MQPMLSILTPTYNGMPFLQNALTSTQTAVETGLIEHVVSDGGSTDGSQSLLAGSHARWNSQSDGGQSEALNNALKNSTSPWIGWLNSDEFYLDGVLDRVIEMIRRDDCDLIFGDYVEIEPDTSAIRLVTQHSIAPPVLEHFGLCLPSCTAFFRRSLVEDHGGWDENSKTMMDWDLWLHILRSGGRFRYTGRAHAAFTRHPEQASTRYAALVAEETAALDDRYGIRRSAATTRSARARRVAAKLLNGGYARELRFARRVRAQAGPIEIGPEPHRDPAAAGLLAPFALR